MKEASDMPTPWGKDNVPPGWLFTDENDTPGPKFLRDILAERRVEVLEPRPPVEWLENAISLFADAIHKLFNDTCRALGVPLDEGQSEATWRVAQEIASRLDQYVQSAWASQDEDRRAKQDELSKAQALVERLKRELGIPSQEASGG
jgi:hypothetical protein